MKLLIDAHYYDGRPAEGVNTYLKGIYSLLPSMAPDIDFYFASPLGDGLSEVLGSAQNVHYIKLHHNTRRGRLLYEFPRLVRKHRFDAAHYQYVAPPEKKCPTIVTLHDLLFVDFPHNFPWWYRVSRDRLFRHSAAKSDAILTVSEYSRERIAEHYGISLDNITVTHNAVDPEFFNAERESAKSRIYSRGIRPYILNVSRLEPRKNQFALVKAFTELELDRRGYDLVLVNRTDIGVPEMERYLEALPAQRRKRIHRMEGMSHHELIDWYAGAELAVYPSLAEGFGIPPLEAAATLTPSLCHNATAMREFTFLGDNLADLSDADTLKRRIEANLASPPDSAELKRIAHQVSERYNWKTSARKVLDTIKNINR